MRKIIHADMDAFFASVEQLDDPTLRGRPIAVGGSPDGRGVVAAASYEARRFGVRSAMPSARAIQVCPALHFVRPRFERYSEISARVFSVFHEITDLVEGLSIDEAFLDVTQNKLGWASATEVARHARLRICEVTGGLTASAGVAPNKFVAKLASDFKKPDGLTVVPPERVQAFLDPLPVGRIWGVGPVTEKRFHVLGLRTIREVRLCEAGYLETEFGAEHAAHFRALARGEDDRPVITEWDRKSFGSETTFERDVRDVSLLSAVLRDQASELAESLRDGDFYARTVTLKLRYSDFTTITRSRTSPRGPPTRDATRIADAACELLTRSTDAGSRPVRLIGVSVSNLIGPDQPLQWWLELP